MKLIEWLLYFFPFNWKLIILILSTSIPFLFPYHVFSQSNLSGYIYSIEDNSPVVGAAIFDPENQNGTLSDNEGNFVLDITDRSDTLKISVVGFQDLDYPINGQSHVSIALQPETRFLNEVVITGYKSQRKEDITGAVSIVNVEAMEEYQAPSFVQQLEGRAAGVHMFYSGEPGSPVDIRIRGISSFTDNDPLYIIDGVPVKDRQMNWLNPNDIEQMQVLKDASAASIYGARANNGVIIIETKKGVEGKVKVSYNGYFGFQQPVKTFENILIQNPLDYGEYIWQRYQNAGLPIPPQFSNIFGSGVKPVVPDYIIKDVGYMDDEVNEDDYLYPENQIIKVDKRGTNWSDELIRKAMITDHNIGVSGGNEKGLYNFSFGYFRQDGTVKFNYLDRYSLRVNSQIDVGVFTFGENLFLSRTQHAYQDYNIRSAMPFLPVYDITGNFAESDFLQNPYATIFRNKDNKTTSENILGNIFIEVELPYYFKFRSSLGFHYDIQTDLNFSFPVPTSTIPQNNFNESWGKFNSLTWTNTLSFNKNFNDHYIGFLAGCEIFNSKGRFIDGYLAGYLETDINVWYLNEAIAEPETKNVLSGGDIEKLTSIFGQIDYHYDNRYLFSFTLRRDGSSKFGTNKYGNFPSISVGWRLSEESFFTDQTWLSELKIRAGYGITGGQNIPSGNAYDIYGGRGPDEAFYDLYGVNNDLVAGLALSKYGNDETRWERNKSLNLGLDLSLKQQLGISFDWYIRNTDGLLYNPVLPGTAGIAEAPFLNVAEIQNKGFDLTLNYHSNLDNKLLFEFGLTLGHYKNEIVKVNNDVDFFSVDNFSGIGVKNLNQVGNPISGFYGYISDGIFQNQEEVEQYIGQPGKQIGRLRFVDLDNDEVISLEDKKIIGNPHPDITAGLNFKFQYKRLEFNALLYSWIGNEIFNNTLFWTELNGFGITNKNIETLSHSWTTMNPNAKIPRLDQEDTYSTNSSTYYVENGSYLRAKLMQLGYNFSSDWLAKIKLSQLRLYIQVQNLFTITNYKGLDPVISLSENDKDLLMGYDNGVYPSSKSFSIGMNVIF